jgi:hypothetical protein
VTVATAGTRSARGFQTATVALPRAGTFALRVTGVTDGRNDTEVAAPYRIETWRRSNGPESAAASVAYGDTVRAERIDHIGDADRFVLTAPTSRDVIVALRGTRDSTGHVFRLRVLNPANGLSGGEVTSSGGTQYTGRIGVPAGGVLWIAVDEDTTRCAQLPCAPGNTLTGAYEFTAYLFDPAPEGRAAEFAIGDTIDGRIEPVGDVDEYRFTASAGDRVRLQLALPDGPNCQMGQGGLNAFILHPVTNLPVRTASASTAGTLDDAPAADVTLSEGGTYTLRVNGWTGSQCAGGRYLARIARLP